MSIRITTLSENTAHIGEFLGEWGLSVLVETDDFVVLLDTGKSASTIYNVDTLGVDLKKVDKIVLSHGHFDHTGGLASVLRRMKKKVDIVAHPDVWQAKYSRRENMPDRYIGIPFQRAELESLGARFALTRDPFKISDSVWTTGEVPMVTEFEQIDRGLFVLENGNWAPDQLMDDRALVIKHNGGLVVVLGCAHRGMINTLYHARSITGVDRIHAVIGGSHLMNTPEERIWSTIAAIREMDIEKVGLCHCTDLPATTVLAHELGERFIFNKAGSVIEIP